MSQYLRLRGLVLAAKKSSTYYIDRGDKIWGFSFVHCGEVYNILSLYWKVLFERFHCIVIFD